MKTNKEVVFWGTVITAGLYILMAWVLTELFNSPAWGLFITVLTAGLLTVCTNFWSIPADPTCEGIRTLFWVPIPSCKLEPGLHFFPGCPLVTGLIMENVSKKNLELPEYTVRLPNNTQVAYRFGLTVFISNVYNFVRAGRWKEILERLQNDIATLLSKWAQSPDYGPQNHEEAIRAVDEVILMLMKGLLGDKLPKLPTSVPTHIVLGYFSNPRPEMTKAEKKLYPDWDAVKNQLIADNPTTAEQEELIKKVEQRMQDFEKIKRGEGDWEKEALGITIVRLNHHQVPKYVGKIAETAEKKAVEQLERAGEREELDFAEEAIKRLSGMNPNDRLKFSPAEARELFQTERKKVEKKVNEVKINLSENSEAALERIANRLIDKIGGDQKKEKEENEKKGENEKW